MSKRRVVVTGLGTVCPVGNDVETMRKTLKTEFVESMKLLILIQRTSKSNWLGKLKTLI